MRARRAAPLTELETSQRCETPPPGSVQRLSRNGYDRNRPAQPPYNLTTGGATSMSVFGIKGELLGSSSGRRLARHAVGPLSDDDKAIKNGAQIVRESQR
jgi:hypothetical protein